MERSNKESAPTLIKIAVKLLIIILLPGMFVSCEKDDTIPPLTDGKAPEFMLNSLEGTSVKLSDYENKVVVLFFFGNECPSCKAAAPDIESMLVTPFTSNMDYQVLGLDQWDGNSISVQAFKTVTGVSFPLLLNASKVAADYKTTYDRLVVIDKSGNIVFSGTQSASADVSIVKQKVQTLLSEQDHNNDNDNDDNPSIAAPDFTLTSLEGNEVKLSDYENNVVVLFFFGNGCPSCKAVAPDVQSMLVTPFASHNDYQVLGLDQWNGNEASVQAFKTSTGVSFPLLLNASGVAANYQTTFDRLIVIDKSGNIVFSGVQPASADISEVKKKVETLLGV